MLNTIHEERVCAGQANEALCFISDRHPKTRIDAQKLTYRKGSGEKITAWYIYYVGKRLSLITGELSQARAEELARIMAHDVLNSANPYRKAKEL